MPHSYTDFKESRRRSAAQVTVSARPLLVRPVFYRSDGRPMAVRWMYDGRPMAARWQSDGRRSNIAPAVVRLWTNVGLLAFQWLSYIGPVAIRWLRFRRLQASVVVLAEAVVSGRY